jgi:hypothetical protein
MTGDEKEAILSMIGENVVDHTLFKPFDLAEMDEILVFFKIEKSQ